MAKDFFQSYELGSAKERAEIIYENYCSFEAIIEDFKAGVYFIRDELVDRLIENGGKHIMDEGVAKEYILLANAFWQQKRDNIKLNFRGD